MPILFSVCKDKEFLAFINENEESYVKCSPDTSEKDLIKRCEFLKICSMTNVGPNGTIQTDKMTRHLGKSEHKQKLMQELHGVISKAMPSHMLKIKNFTFSI